MNCSELTSGQLDTDTQPVKYFYDGKCSAQQTAACFTPQSPNYAKGKLSQVKSSVSETRYTTFDNLGRLTQMEQRTPVGGETIANATARVSSYQYNFAGTLIHETYPSGRTVSSEFEADGDLSRIYGKANSSAIGEWRPTVLIILRAARFNARSSAIIAGNPPSSTTVCK